MEKRGGHTMVNGTSALKLQNTDTEIVDSVFLPDPLKYTSVSLNEVFDNNTRFEASAFNLDAKAAKYKVTHCKYGYTYLWGVNGLVKDAYVCGRFKRIYVEKNTNCIPFYLPSAITDVYPKPSKYISPKTDVNIDSLKVKKGMLLMSVSGTIGRCSIVGDYLDNAVFSHDMLRLYGLGKYDVGYIYAFFNTKIGQAILQTNNYGAVIQHIEPEHLRNIVIPNAPEEIRKEIHNLVIESYNLRDQSNALLDEAEKILYQELQLPPIETLKPKYYDESIDLRNYTTRLKDLNLRLDGSYHIPICKSILEILRKNSLEIHHCGDKNISKEIYLPIRFKRNYVDEGNGLKLIGGKQINELIPSSEKFLAHSKLDNELKFKANSILITRSGTIGKSAMVPKHWENWVGSDHIFRIIPANNQIAGYLFCWLNTEYALQLIERNIFGSVVDEIDTTQLSSVEIPFLKSSEKQNEINSKVLQANELRYQAFLLEQKAVKMMERIME